MKFWVSVLEKKNVKVIFYRFLDFIFLGFIISLDYILLIVVFRFLFAWVYFFGYRVYIKKKVFSASLSDYFFFRKTNFFRASSFFFIYFCYLPTSTLTFRLKKTRLKKNYLESSWFNCLDKINLTSFLFIIIFRVKRVWLHLQAF